MTGSVPPSESFEVEVTYDVDESTPLPDWSSLPGVVRVDEPEVRHLDARYFDTETYDLGRAHYALRRREGGHDAGWHLKGPRSAEGRLETGWPLDEGESVDAASVPAVPAAIRAHIAHLTPGPLVPIARIRNTRVASALRDADGAVVAEFVDDRVRTRDERSGTERSWREWEIELGPAGPRGEASRRAFFAAVARAVETVGAREASSDSKLARALGL